MKLEPNCYLEIALNLSFFTAMTSALQINLLNCERFLGIHFPVWHRSNVTVKRLVVAAAVAWFVGAISVVFKFFRAEGRFLVLSILVASSISTMVFAIMIWRGIAVRNLVQAGSHQNQPNPIFTNAEKKAAKLATYLAVGYLFTRVVPFVALILINAKPELRNVVAPILYSLRLLNALLNPIIYGVLNTDIRQACLDLMKCR